MTSVKPSASTAAWEAIEQEKRRDRFIRRVCVAAWSVTFAFALALAVLVGIQVKEMLKAVMVGALPMISVIGVAMPIVIVFGLLSVLIATLTTIGIFLRLRTASLQEIQLRLAALEEMILADRAT